MDEHDRLMLHEEVLLLVLRDEEGTVASGPMYEYAIAGGILAELLLADRLEIVDSGRRKKKQVVEVKSTTPMSNAVIDECLEKARSIGKQRSPQHLVMTFARTKDLKRRVADRLCKLGILREEQQKVLWVFHRDVFPEVDHRAEAEFVARLERAIFTDTPDVDIRTILLASLANSANLLPLFFDKKRLKARSERLRQLVEAEVVGRATSSAIQAVQAALSVIAISTAATTH